MRVAERWSRILLIIGLVSMLFGALDPLEGSVIVLLGSGVVAVGAYVGKSRHRTLLYWACGLIAAGVGALVVLTMLGGAGGGTGRSRWWGLSMLPYPVGWIMGLVGTILSLRKRAKRPA